MARLQLLYLPSIVADGDPIEPSFALVVDQAPEDMHSREVSRLQAFAHEIGASGCLITGLALDVVDGSTSEDDDALLTWDHREFAREVADIVRRRMEAPAPAKPCRCEQ